MRGNGAFPEDFPSAISQRQVDDGGGQRAAGGAAIDDEGNAVADLVANARGVGALGCALQIGGCGRDGQAEALDDGAWNGGVGDAQGDIAGVGRGTQGSLVPARTMMVSGPGQKRSASLSSMGSLSRASSYA